MTPGLRIRRATGADAPELAKLAGQLGYPTDAMAIRQRLRDIDEQGAGIVLVAENGDGAITGTAHVHAEYSVVDDPKAHLADLVVDESFRSAGIGAALLHATESWAREHGLSRMRVNSNVIRERAHRFYLREGYAENKRQAVFLKQLI